MQVAVFDTAFHQSMPPAAYMYALPWDLYEQRGIRRYGAHGTSYQYLVGAAARALQRDASQLNLVIAHVGLLLSGAHCQLPGSAVPAVQPHAMPGR